MEGSYYRVNSEFTKKCAIDAIHDAFNNHKLGYVKLFFGKRTLPQNALKSVWYAEIAKERGDVTAREVENECKLNFGIPILRRDPGNNWIYENSIDKLPYEKRVKAMTRFAVTSLMSVKELTEYIKEMQNAYPYLEARK
jgi:hypothetical protein